MNRGGGARPGMGGNTMAGNMLGGMFGPRQSGGSMSPQQPGGSGGGYGGSQGGFGGPIIPRSNAAWNNYGMGMAPPQFTDSMFRLQQQCLAGDGAACNQLQVAQMQQQQKIDEWNQQRNMRGQWLDTAGRGGSMGARKSW